MLLSCHACPGFVPESAEACPHCGASLLGVGAPAGVAAGVAKVAAVGAMMVTLMACYGDSSYDPPCHTNDDCSSGLVCQSGSCNYVEEICDNDIDDDEDGLPDTADPDCNTHETLCHDGVDNDGDLLIDCVDSDCAEDPGCMGCVGLDCPQEVCDDGIDNDQDGETDCADSDCAGSCGPPVCGDGNLQGGEECDDANIDPGDGCSDTCTIEFDVVCAELPTLAEGVTEGTTEGGTNVMSGTCIPAGGAESLYYFTAPSAGTLTVDLDPDVSLGIYGLAFCGDGAAKLSCSDLPDVEVDTLTFELASGQSIVIAVDSADPAVLGTYTLTTTFAPQI